MVSRAQILRQIAIRFLLAFDVLAIGFLLASPAHAQTLEYRRPVRGNLFLPPGTSANGSRIRIQLKYCSGSVGRVPVNPGNPPGAGSVVNFTPFEVLVQSDGSWSTNLFGNDQIVCGVDMSGPSRWLIQPVFNGVANAGGEYQIQSCGAIPITGCAPFLPDSAPACSVTVTHNCNMNGGVVGPDTWVTVNGIVPVPNALDFNSRLLPPAGNTAVTFMLNGNNVSAYVPSGGGGGGGGGITGATPNMGLLQSGTTLGLTTSCTSSQYLSWSGSAWTCTTLTGGAGGVTSINGTAGAFTFSGAGVSCSGTTCTFSGGGSAGLPQLPQYELYASNGSGGGQGTLVKANNGFMESKIVTVTGGALSPPFTLPPNGSLEWFPTGAYGVSNGNGVTFVVGHSSGTTASQNAGIALIGDNSSNQGNQVYLNCSMAAGCDFRGANAPTFNGNPLGGGGTGGGSGTVSTGTIGEFASYTGTTTVGSNPNLDDGLTTPGSITIKEPLAFVSSTAGAGFSMTATGGTLPSGTATGSGGIGIGPGGIPLIYSLGNNWHPITYMQVGGTYLATNLANFNNNNLPARPTASAPIVFQNNGTDGNISAYLATSGNASDCFLGNGTFGTCPGGTGGGTVNNPIMFPASAGTLAPVANEGGFGVGPQGQPMVSANGGAFIQPSSISVNGATPANGQITQNFNATTPAAPAGNFQNVTFVRTGSSISAYIPIAPLSNNSTDCLLGTGAFGPCPGGTGGMIWPTFTSPSSIPNQTGTTTWGQSYSASNPIPAAMVGTVGMTWPTGAAGIPAYSGSSTWGASYNATNPIPSNYLPTTLTGSLTGNAATATALQSNPTTCTTTGQFATGILASGNATGCAAPTVSALSSNGTANQVWGMGPGVVQGWQTITTGAGSGTVNPNSGTAGALAYYTAAGGSTTVDPAPGVVNATATNSGINVGTGVVQFGTSLTAADLSIDRQSTGVLAIGSGGANANGWLTQQNTNSCPISADIAFSNSAVGTVCNRSLPASRSWIVHCALPWNFTTGQTGNAVVTVNVNQGSVSTGVTSTTPSVWTTVLWGTAGPVFGDVFQTAAGFTQLVQTTSLSLSDGRIYTLYIDGVAITNTAAAFNVQFSITTGTGTAVVRQGGFCRYE